MGVGHIAVIAEFGAQRAHVSDTAGQSHGVLSPSMPRGVRQP